MSIIERAHHRALGRRRRRRRNFEPPANFPRRRSDHADYVRGSRPGTICSAGARPAGADRYTAATSTAIYACTNLISGAIATLPVNIYRVDVKTASAIGFSTIRCSGFSTRKCRRAGRRRSAGNFCAKSLLFEGDAFAIIKRDRAGAADRPRACASAARANGVDRRRLAHGLSRAPEIINGSMIGSRGSRPGRRLHVPGFGFDGLRGMSPLRYSLRNAGASRSRTQEYAGNFFANGARPDYALTTDVKLGEPKIKELQDLIDERHRGPKTRIGRCCCIPASRFSAVDLGQADMQLLEQRQFQIEEIARAYGVPPFMIGHNEKTTSWGSGVEAMGSALSATRCGSISTSSRSSSIASCSGRATRVAEFDTSDLEQADTATLMSRCASASAAPASRASSRRRGARRAHASKRAATAISSSASIPAPTPAIPPRSRTRSNRKDLQHEKPAAQPAFRQRQARHVPRRGRRGQHASSSMT
jgi:phage portal protein BeeE